jgi:maltooligosyltrehalose trehalohydrolase
MLKKHLGARLLTNGRCEFRAWAPQRENVGVRIGSHTFPMQKTADGYHEATLNARAGTRYFYILDDVARPDPASRFQPEGVHGPSEVIDPDFDWRDAQFRRPPLEEFVIYELHTGTFTSEGTFDAIIPKLAGLKELGITAVELMPIGQFPGPRNWGYDGTFVYAAQNSYGGPEALKRLVNAAHQHGLAIILDVVYNHLGPEGNYLSEFAPYFTDRYKTAWGMALNFDGPHSDHVRDYFIQNALMWVDEFHFDALRVDAVHAIVDHSAEPFLQDLTAAIGDRAIMIGESDLNDPRVITPRDQLGLGFHTQWCDDFHHALHAMLTGETSGYYAGYGKASDLARAIECGYIYTGQYSEFRRRKYGRMPKTANGAQFIVSAQNHDQVGNRMNGERLSTLVSRDKLRVAAAATILSPFIPMLFMGEEYGETAPFQYFTSHSDEGLIEAVRNGRRREFEEFAWQGEAPDPHDEQTFQRSKLTWREDREIRDFYRELLRLRREKFPSLDLSKVKATADDTRKTVTVRRGDTVLELDFGEKPGWKIMSSRA